MEQKSTYLGLPSARTVFFWICVLLYFMFSSNIENFGGGYYQLFFSTLKIVSFQLITAYVCIKILIPKYLDTRRIDLFTLWVIVLQVISYIGYVAVHLFLYQPRFIQYYNDLQLHYADVPFIERITSFDVFLSKAIKFLTPTALLVMFRFYKDQQQLLQLKEQKKTAELDALKHQLNPHFLFNTLNNLYSLALEKSDKTPEVIERLSEILDYILFQCKDTYVSIHKEVELIENYLALEKVRYGKRVSISFQHDVDSKARIAPLILLTFIENAFKHGVKQELNNATIDIDLSVKEDMIYFNIANTKPPQGEGNGKEKLGLKNVKKQLALLYPESHTLSTQESDESYLVNLQLNVR